MVCAGDQEPLRRKEHGFVIGQRFKAKPPVEDGGGWTDLADVLILGVQGGCICRWHKILSPLRIAPCPRPLLREGPEARGAWSLSVEGFRSSATPVCHAALCALFLIPTSATGEGHAVGQTTERSASVSLPRPPSWSQRADPRAKASSPGDTAPLFLLPRPRRARGYLVQLQANDVAAVPHIPLNVARDCEHGPVRYARLVQRRPRRGCQPPVMGLVLAKVRRQVEMQRYHQAALVRVPPQGAQEP